MPEKKLLVILVSGSGTTLAGLAEACKTDKLKAIIHAVISNKLGVKAGEIAAKYELVPYVMITREYIFRNDKGEYEEKDAYGSDELHSEKVLDQASFSNPDLIVCAGYNAKLHVTKRWEGRILNIHPSLLPKYGGKGMYGHRIHQAVLDAKEEWTGCTVHVVDNEYDHGTIIAQSRVRVMPNDTAATLAARVQVAERAIYAEVIQSYLEGKWVANIERRHYKQMETTV